MTAAQTTDGSAQAREGKQRQNQGRRNGGGGGGGGAQGR